MGRAPAASPATPVDALLDRYQSASSIALRNLIVSKAYGLLVAAAKRIGRSLPRADMGDLLG